MPGPGRSDLFRKLLARILSGGLQEEDETAQHRPGMGQAVDMIKSLGALQQPRGAFAAPTAELLEPIERPDLAAGDAKQAEDAAAAAKKLKELAAAREQDEWVRSVGYEPSQEFSDPEKGILVGDIDADKLKKIRDQAAAKFPGATGGNFISAEMTPEVAARQQANEEWASGQALRDIKFQLSQRDQEKPAAAAEGISRIAEQERAAQDQRSRDVLIDALAGMESGKIPWDKAMVYEARNIPIPQDRIGVSGEEALNEANVLMATAQDDIGKASSDLNTMMNPELGLSGEFARRAAPIIAQYAQEARGADPQAARDRFLKRFAEVRAEFLAEIRKRPQGLEENFGIKIERPGGGGGPLKGGERFTSGS